MSAQPFDPSAPAQFDGIFGLPHAAEDAHVVILPVPWEPTTSYRKGTRGGPANVLEASRQVDLFDRETGRPYERGIALLAEDEQVVELNRAACDDAQPIIERGGAGDDAELLARLARVNQASLALNERVRATAESWLSRGRLVGVLGGDHSSPFGLIQAVAARHPGLGVLHVDAHADLRDAYEGFVHSHASIMFNVHREIPGVERIVQVGVRDFSEQEHELSQGSTRIETFYDADLAQRAEAGEPFAKTAKEIVERLPREVFVSFDIDGLEPGLCPRTGTPVPGGLSFREACALLRAVAASGRRIVGFDLNEVAGDGEWDGIVGARVLYKLIGYALLSARD